MALDYVHLWAGRLSPHTQFDVKTWICWDAEPNQSPLSVFRWILEYYSGIEDGRIYPKAAFKLNKQHVTHISPQLIFIVHIYGFEWLWAMPNRFTYQPQERKRQFKCDAHIDQYYTFQGHRKSWNCLQRIIYIDITYL